MKSILIFLSLGLVVQQSETILSKYYGKAVIVKDPTKSDNVEGEIFFSQTEGEVVEIYGQVNGLSDGPHGFHVHESGNITQSCVDALAHYNPQKVSHAGPEDAERHAGDLGNIDSLNKVATVNKKDSLVKLYGEQSIIGRAVVIHELVDDLGKSGQSDSKTTGHAGSRLACGKILQVDSLDVEDQKEGNGNLLRLTIVFTVIAAICI